MLLWPISLRIWSSQYHRHPCFSWSRDFPPSLLAVWTPASCLWRFPASRLCEPDQSTPQNCLNFSSAGWNTNTNKWSRQYDLSTLIYIARVRRTREGNVFSLFVRPGGGGGGGGGGRVGTPGLSYSQACSRRVPLDRTGDTPPSTLVGGTPSCGYAGGLSCFWICLIKEEIEYMCPIMLPHKTFEPSDTVKLPTRTRVSLFVCRRWCGISSLTWEYEPPRLARRTAGSRSSTAAGPLGTNSLWKTSSGVHSQNGSCSWN